MLFLILQEDNSSDLRKLTRNKNGETNSSYEHSLVESSMDSDSGHQNPRSFPRSSGRTPLRQMTHDEDGDFVNNFRDEGLNVVDKYARIVFPVSYLLFNICYWIIYLTS